MAAEFQARVLGPLKQKALTLTGILPFAGVAGGLAIAVALTRIDAEALNMASGKSLTRRQRRTADRKSDRRGGNAAAGNEIHLHLILPKGKRPKRVRSAPCANELIRYGLDGCYGDHESVS